jgi:hypothetical protein
LIKRTSQYHGIGMHSGIPIHAIRQTRK